MVRAAAAAAAAASSVPVTPAPTARTAALPPLALVVSAVAPAAPWLAVTIMSLAAALARCAHTVGRPSTARLLAAGARGLRHLEALRSFSGGSCKACGVGGGPLCAAGQLSVYEYKSSAQPQGVSEGESVLPHPAFCLSSSQRQACPAWRSVRLVQQSRRTSQRLQAHQAVGPLLRLAVAARRSPCCSRPCGCARQAHGGRAWRAQRRRGARARTATGVSGR